MSYKVPEDASEDDVYQWLSEGYVRHVETGTTLRYEGDYDGVHASFWDGDDLHRLSISDVECHWPVCGMVNIRQSNTNVALYVARQQRRQWRRTFNPMCVNVHVIGRWGAVKRFGRPRARRLERTDMRVVDALFNPEYATVQEAIRRINGGAVSVAISPQVALAGDGKGVFAVYYRDTMVGGMQNGVYVPVVTGRCSDMAKRLVEEALV